MSGTLYLSGQEHCSLLNEVYTRFSHTNPMHADVFPSVRQMELEVLAMTASMVGGEHVLPPRIAWHPVDLRSKSSNHPFWLEGNLPWMSHQQGVLCNHYGYSQPKLRL